MTFDGGCHCGAVRFEARIDAGNGTGKCNCSYCAKTRFWKVVAESDCFRLLAGNDLLADYRFGEELVHHFFCRCCGIPVFARSDLGDPARDVFAVNVACLGDDAILALLAAPMRFEDGRNDDWWSEPAETRHL
ncbi:MAG TPA: GFA family protein [Gammaproteobacteria bacterium]